jgi:hypothetical protein
MVVLSSEAKANYYLVTVGNTVHIGLGMFLLKDGL